MNREMWQRKFKCFLQIIPFISSNILTMIIKKHRVLQQPTFKRPLLISSGIFGFTAILALSLVGLFKYTPDTSASFPYILPPAEGSSYYIESTTENLWNTFFSPYGDYDLALRKHVGNSIIFKNFLISDYVLDRININETYFLYNSIKFVTSDPSELQKLKDRDVIDIIGVCVSLDERNAYVIMENCQFLPAGLAPIPLPGGPGPLSGGY